LLNWNGDLNNPNDGKDDGTVDVESDIEHDSGIEHQACPVQQDVSAAPNVPRLIR